jgi:hypothetical protein
MYCLWSYVHIRGGIQNFMDWCRHLYSSCGSAKHWWMVGLPCLVSQFAKLHVAGWMWAVFTCVWSRVQRNIECAPHTRCSFLWSIVKIATHHVHDSKQTRVKTAHVHPAMCNLAHWLIRHGSPTTHQCFALQLLYRWWHQSGKFCIPPRTFVCMPSLYQLVSCSHGLVLTARIKLSTSWSLNSLNPACNGAPIDCTTSIHSTQPFVNVPHTFFHCH